MCPLHQYTDGGLRNVWQGEHMSRLDCWTVEELPRAIVDTVRGRSLPRGEPPGAFVKCRGRVVEPSLSDEDWNELSKVWLAAGLPLDPLTRPLDMFTALPYLEAFNERDDAPSWQLGFVARDDMFPERVGAAIEEQRVRDALRDAIGSGKVVPRWPGSMVKAKPHEVGCARGLVLTAADLELIVPIVPQAVELVAVMPGQAPEAVEQDSASASTDAGSAPAGEDEMPEQRRERIQARVSHWKNQGVRDFTARVANEEKVTVARIRQILGRGKKESVTKKQKAKPRKRATPFSGLM